MVEDGVELLHGQPAAPGPRVRDRLDRDRHIREEDRVGDLNFIEIRILIGIIGNHQHERGQLRPQRVNRDGELRRGEGPVILDVAAVHNAVDDVVLDVADGPGRRNDREPRRVVRGRAQAHVIEALPGKDERELFTDILPEEIALNARPEIDIGVVRQQRMEPRRLHEDRAILRDVFGHVSLSGDRFRF